MISYPKKASFFEMWYRKQGKHFLGDDDDEDKLGHHDQNTYLSKKQTNFDCYRKIKFKNIQK